MLTKDEIRRYSRHLKLENFGLSGQEKLKNAKVLVIGAGGLGSPCLLYLAAAGIGTIGIIDNDRVDDSNLQRQIVHNSHRVGQAKVESARETLSALNPYIQVQVYPCFLTSENALELFKQYDLVIDGCDSLAVRYVINDACVKAGIPFVYGSIYRYDGQVAILNTKDGPCYRCLYPEPPESIPSCSEAGVLGVLPGIIGVTQATEAIKYITGIGEPLTSHLLIMDALHNEYNRLGIRKDPNCHACGQWQLTDIGHIPDVSCEAPIAQPALSYEITPRDASAMIEDDRHQLIDVRNDYEHQYSAIEEALHFPLPEILAGRHDAALAELGHKPIILYCLGGVRSRTARDYLVEKLKLDHRVPVYSMAGGIKAWSKTVRPIDYFQ